MKKVKKVLLLTIIMFIVKITPVFAGNMLDRNDFCAATGDCILLCRYENLNNDHYNVFIYYSFVHNDVHDLNTFYAGWPVSGGDNPAHGYKKLDDRSYIFIPQDAKTKLTSEGLCPQNGYYDVHFLAGQNEACFDSDGTYCTTSDPGGWWTDFGGWSTLEYNYEDYIRSYSENILAQLSSSSCDEYRATADAADENGIDLKTPFSSDFAQNFLHGDALPPFIENSASYKEFMENLDSELDAIKDRCDTEVKEDEELSETEREELLEENEEANANLEDQRDEMEEMMDVGYDYYANQFNPSRGDQSCTSLLGKTDDSNAPAYYLMIVFNVIKYIAIILLIVLSITDMIQAVSSRDDEIIKKATGKLGKRVVFCIIIFLFPYVLRFILDLINDAAVGECLTEIAGK